MALDPVCPSSPAWSAPTVSGRDGQPLPHQLSLDLFNWRFQGGNLDLTASTVSALLLRYDRCLPGVFASNHCGIWVPGTELGIMKISTPMATEIKALKYQRH